MEPTRFYSTLSRESLWKVTQLGGEGKERYKLFSQGLFVWNYLCLNFLPLIIIMLLQLGGHFNMGISYPAFKKNNEGQSVFLALLFKSASNLK